MLRMLNASSTDDWLRTGVSVGVVVIGTLVLRWLAIRAINRLVGRIADEPPAQGRAGRMLQQATGLAAQRRRQRAQTMGSLLRSATTVTLFVIAVLTIMATLGIPFAPLLASAGVGGVALGFGAQSLVRDFLSGIFMIVEDQYGVGDVIDTGEAIGTVVAVSLRITTLRDGDGVLWYIRNGEIIRIGNRSQGWSTATVDIPVALDESPHRVIRVLEDVCDHIRDHSPWDARILETPEVAGVESVDRGAMTIRIVAKCAPNENLTASRELREQCKVALDEAGVRPPAEAPRVGGSSPAP